MVARRHHVDEGRSNGPALCESETGDHPEIPRFASAATALTNAASLLGQTPAARVAFNAGSLAPSVCRLQITRLSSSRGAAASPKHVLLISQWDGSCQPAQEPRRQPSSLPKPPLSFLKFAMPTCGDTPSRALVPHKTTNRTGMSGRQCEVSRVSESVISCTTFYVH